MKKLLTFILMIVMVASLAACSMLPEDVQATINGVIDEIKGNGGGEHVHNFAIRESKDATCLEDGFTVLKCECGEAKEPEVIAALGHDLQYSQTKPTCTKAGSDNYTCTRCDYVEKTSIEALGHQYPEYTEPSRFVTCTRSGCNHYKALEIGSGGKYVDVLVFTFGDTEKAALEAKHNELANLLAAADKYDPTVHGYAESGALYDAYQVAETLYEEYSDLIYDAQGQYSIAMTLYYCDYRNDDLEKMYNDMQVYYTDLVAKFYSLSQPWYDSMFRDFFFYGATEEEINAFLFDSNALADEEYTRLKNRNDEIELEYNSISNPLSSQLVPELYAEFVENANAMAKRLGYDNYLEYAYENVYDRDYTPEDVAGFVEYVKEYIVPLHNSLYPRGTSASGPDVLSKYNEVMVNSFFEKRWINETFNNYLDDMNMAFTSNPDKLISFSDEFNNLITDGNLFRGTYGGAYVTYVSGLNIPIAFFGKGYDNSMTFAHEFGHYMNEVYNQSEYNQSYDLLETHSQGDESLFLAYLGTVMKSSMKAAFNHIERIQLRSSIATIIFSVQVDCFEQAIYLNSYDGVNSDIIMADGKITADEYDLLYESIAKDLGIKVDATVNNYWRYGMTISSPCYYISYAISGINALQIYAMAKTDFETAKDSYLKLFTYTDVDPDMTDAQILEYAGMISYTDEQLYKNIYNAFK